MNLTFGSVCSGIEAASVGFTGLPMTAAWFAEIEPFPCAVLEARHPGVPNLGDMTAIADRIRSGEVMAPDFLVGGTPCQSFSVAGLRKGLSDERGNLTLEYIRILDAIDDVRETNGASRSFCLYENVPGILSSTDNAFGCFLAGLVGEDAPLVPGRSGWTDAGVVAGPRRVAAWRVIDAQGFVPQRRRRVFVVASGDVVRLDPVRVLFEAEAAAFGSLGERAYTGPLFPVSEGMRGNFKKGGQSRERPAPCLAARTRGGGGLGTDFDLDGGLIAHSLRAEGFDASEDGTGRGVPLVCGTLSDGAHMGGGSTARTPTRAGSSPWLPEIAGCLQERDAKGADSDTKPGHLIPVGGGFDEAIPFDTTQITSKANRSSPQSGDPSHPLAAHAHAPAIAFTTEQTPKFSSDSAFTITQGSPTGGGHPQCIAFNLRGREGGAMPEESDVASMRAASGGSSRSYVAAPIAFNHQAAGKQTTLGANTLGANTLGANTTQAVARGVQVRRLTPVECARLQSFPDEYLDITIRGKPAADGPKYRALGNSMNTAVMSWLGRQIVKALS